jgi:hypothetical protein
LVIKQECQECGYETQFLLTPENTRVLFEHLPKLMQEQKQNWIGYDKPPEI